MAKRRNKTDKKPYEIITAVSDAQRLERLAEQLPSRDRKLICGGMSEFSSGPGQSWECACVYWLYRSADGRTYGLWVTEHDPVLDDCDADRSPYDGDVYLWSLDNCDTKEWMGAVAIVEEGAQVDESEIAQALVDAFVNDGGICITDYRC